MGKNDKKKQQLEMSVGKANYRLNRSIMFHLVQETARDRCFQCGEIIKDIDDFSVEHKIPWMDSENPKELYFDLDNIAFSHKSCNYSNIRVNKSTFKYDWGNQEGNNNNNCKLTKDEVIEIRRLYATGKVTQKFLGKMFNVSGRNICKIINRNSWKLV